MSLNDIETYKVIDDVNSYYRLESESKGELLLNKYPNAAAAYSLRLLDGYYREPLVRVRRDDGVEVDVYPDYNNQLSLDSLVTNVPVHTTNDGIPDADYTFQLSLSSLGEFVGATGYSGNVAATNATVCVWYDQSSTDGVPNDNDASQSVATNQPLIVSSGVIVTENGKPALDYTGSVNILLRVNSLNISQPSTVFIVGQGGTANRNFMDGVTLTDRQTINTYNGYAYYAGANNVQIASTLNTDQHLFYALFNGANSEGGIDANAAVTGNPGTQSLTALTIGNSRESNDGCDGTMQEFILYESNKSANRTDIEEDINSFYQIDGYTPPPKLIDLTQDLAVENGGTIADGTPAAAYSLRLLSSTYNGPLVRIRRTIDNTEVDVYPDSDGQFSIYSTIQDGGTELTTGVTGGSTDKTTLHEFLYGQDTDCMVVRWYDQASGNHATQDVATSQPKIYDSATGVVNDPDTTKPAVQFIDTSGTFVDTQYVPSTGDLSIFAVSHDNDTSDFGHIVGNDALQSAAVGDIMLYTSLSDLKNNLYAHSGTAGFNIKGGTVGNANVLTVVNNGTATLYQDGTLIGSNTMTTTYNANSLTIGGGNGTNAARCFNGHISELLLYPSDESTNRTNIESNINQHYNIY